MENKEKGKRMILLLIGLFLGQLVYFIWSKGFVLVKLWSWFVIYFGNLIGIEIPELSLMLAIGLSLFASYFVGTNSLAELYEDQDQDLLARILKIIISLLLPWVILGVGWIIKDILIK